MLVVIGVCTARRPKMLSRCLDSIVRQRLPDDAAVHLIVADNEVEPNNATTVAQFASISPFPVHYLHEPRRGIAIARNTILNKAEELQADWLAFTDDDCRVASDWTYWLLKAAEWYGADIIYGKQEFIYPENTPEWAKRKPRNLTEGQLMKYIGTHNVLISSRLFCGKDGVRFNEKLSFSEDSDFLYQCLGLRFDENVTHGSDNLFGDEARKHGAYVVHSCKPLVWEDVPPERATFGFQLRLAYRFALANSNRNVRYYGWFGAAVRAIIQFLIKVPVAILKLLWAIILRPFSREERFKKRSLKHLQRLTSSVGWIIGLFGQPGNPYRKIQGQ